MKTVNELPQTGIFEKSITLSEVEVKYKTKVKAADRIKVTGSAIAADYVRTAIGVNHIEHVEHMIVLLLNRANHILGWAKISTGGLSGTVCDPKLVFQIALGANASCVILAHNHPSGNTKPSEQDKTITAKIKKGADLLDIQLLDHVIVTEESHFSFADEGIL